ncbi:M20/M25/M40 family metallo-hydrolase [Lentibacillus salicampi]|uniref:M20/M25/M40 family metallo-hydrolase n=1 Tax=Lentibacillus salicampi TaxID=175306 RepID=A0A4Y9AF71_9BACI|nr:M20/M25/M40 family metallo-hydrolase [Lentibacillus salicampi]TFJ93747.1 M20/M25/M40 family metallo-hydrolase [Lentibacillus salicampi]
MKTWQTKEQLLDLLSSLVNHQSITGSNAEIALAEYLQHLLAQKPYFQENPDHLQLHPLEDGRRLLTALVKGNDSPETVILLSHFDVVGVDDYGSLKNLAFYPEELTKEMANMKERLPEAVQTDISSGEWLFGRGTMDMKAGITLHLSMLEKAMDGEFNGNILLLSVPDEEVNSQGMMTSLPVLEQVKKEENLTYNACLNGEPMFSKYPGDNHYYVYAGSIGKVLPGFYCYGQESHVGEPFAGINPNLMVSFLSQQLELNEAFIEKVGDDVTPPPVSLMQRDLKEHYSVQTPNAAIAMYNVLYLKQTFQEINDKLLAGARTAAGNIERYIQQKSNHFAGVVNDFTMPDSHVAVMMYEDLYREAVKRHGEEEVTRRQNLLVSQRDQGDRDFSTILVQELAAMCKDLAPMIVLFYSPPFYPAVSSFDDPYIQHVMEDIRDYTRAHYQLDLTVAEFFTGLSDLSFVGPVSSESRLQQLTTNMPLQHNGFSFPENIMEQLTMPILNIGPLGKDPHQWTERLELTYSFDHLPSILTEAIHRLFK